MTFKSIFSVLKNLDSLSTKNNIEDELKTFILLHGFARCDHS